MKMFSRISDWCLRHYEVGIIFLIFIMMVAERRTSFEWVIFFLFAGVIGSISKLRLFLAEKEARDIIREKADRKREQFERYIEQEKKAN